MSIFYTHKDTLPIRLRSHITSLPKPMSSISRSTTQGYRQALTILTICDIKKAVPFESTAFYFMYYSLSIAKRSKHAFNYSVTSAASLPDSCGRGRRSPRSPLSPRIGRSERSPRTGRSGRGRRSRST